MIRREVFSKRYFNTSSTSRGLPFSGSRNFVKFQNPQLEGARQFVETSFQEEFEFTAVANWYENQFGRPLALLPTTRNVALNDSKANN
ncbi:hypothetical protein KHA80_17155 [Anaerobacillus sp. HL2]|nr:hypothetical protein KHA80_17155 [Anaerobacillus sp. HL2]